MRPFTLGFTTLLHGFFTLMWVVVLFDVGSPTFNFSVPAWSVTQGLLAVAVVFTASAALGLVMHTISRAVFHRLKHLWAFEVLQSKTVASRFTALEPVETFPGGPSYSAAVDAGDAQRVVKAGGFLHAIEYQLLARAPDVWQRLQAYRDQYRLARGFILPSAAFALILPFWAPIAALDSAGTIGPFPIIRTQLFLLSLLAAAVSYVSFRERSYRYVAAQILAYTTLASQRK